MKRNVIRIDEVKCTGCALCLPNCPEGAIQMIDGKARLVSDSFCDGLGACLGHCPEGAITIEPREAGAFDEEAVKTHLAQPEPQKEPPLFVCPGMASHQFQREASVRDEPGVED